MYYYPVMVLPKILENLLETTAIDNSLLSWSIFQEKNGHIVVKVKFENGLSSFKHERSYKRKSTKQVLRDQARSKEWKQHLKSRSSYRDDTGISCVTDFLTQISLV